MYRGIAALVLAACHETSAMKLHSEELRAPAPAPLPLQSLPVLPAVPAEPVLPEGLTGPPIAVPPILQAGPTVIAAAPAAMVPDLMAPPPGPAPAAGVEKDQHYLSETYTFLRSSNNRVGGGIEVMLGVQTNLDTLGKDLNSEYDHWMAKRTDLLAERDRLAMETARLQAAVEEQKKKRAEKARLERDRDLLGKENIALRISNDGFQKGRLVEIMKHKDRATSLEVISAKSLDSKVGIASDANVRTQDVRTKNKVIQKQIFELNQQVLTLEDERSKSSVAHQKVHQAVLMEIESTQKTIHEYQRQVIFQAQLQQSTRDFRGQVVAQAQQTMKQRNAVIGLQQNCTAQLKQADQDITNAKLSLQQANTVLSDCQSLDGTNQQVQAKLNHCNLMAKTSGH